MTRAVFGADGMVGRAIIRSTPGPVLSIRRRDGDLRDLTAVHRIFASLPPLDVLYLCAARVGGIFDNLAHPGELIYHNLAIQSNVIEAARVHRTKLVVFLGSSCIYPRYAPQPLVESSIGDGLPEPTNAAYAISKLAGVKMLEAYHQQYGLEYLVPMPCNLFGPYDNFNLDTGHMVPALIHRFHDAVESNLDSVRLPGTGTPRREILHVDDLAAAINFLVSGGVRGIVNVGRGLDSSISDIADLIRQLSGYEGSIEFDGDKSKDGIPSKLMARNLALATWRPTQLLDSLERTIRWYRNGRVSVKQQDNILEASV